MLSGRALTVRAGSATLLREVSVAVAPGELVAVVGPNGAGKSTLLETLAGDRRPASGVVRCEDRPLAVWSPRALARVRAVVLQRSALTFAFTALEVVRLGRAPHRGRAGAAGDRAIADAALRAAGAGGLRDQPYPTLSGGERQRVHFARALAQIWERPASGGRYLLLDEPTAALDLSHQQQVLERARAWARDGTGVLVVLHDLTLAAAHADRIIVLSGGRVVADGLAREVLCPRLITAVFGIEVVIAEHPDGAAPVVLPRRMPAQR
ncbi:heme ABC transporter ATP-binding protein [bacterium]|nr:heme ABC transporter ATP-binding protein [bacterium]